MPKHYIDLQGKDAPIMGIRRVTSEFMNHGKELLRRLRTPEANMLTDIEIRMLRLQLHLLDIELSNSTTPPSTKARLERWRGGGL